MNDIFAGNLSRWAWFTVWSLTNRAPRLFWLKLRKDFFSLPEASWAREFFPKQQYDELDHGNKSYFLGEITPRRVPTSETPPTKVNAIISADLTEMTFFCHIATPPTLLERVMMTIELKFPHTDFYDKRCNSLRKAASICWRLTRPAVTA